MSPLGTKAGWMFVCRYPSCESAEFIEGGSEQSGLADLTADGWYHDLENKAIYCPIHTP